MTKKLKQNLVLDKRFKPFVENTELSHEYNKDIRTGEKIKNEGLFDPLENVEFSDSSEISQEEQPSSADESGSVELESYQSSIIEPETTNADENLMLTSDSDFEEDELESETSETTLINQCYSEKLNQKIEYGDSSKRIAIMKCQWNEINAKDLYLICHSVCADSKFTKTDGNLVSDKLISVNIYLSEFGKEEIEYEKKNGPRIIASIGKDVKVLQHDDQNEESSLKTADRVISFAYERAKSMYYYAIVECVNVETAEIIFSELDGISTHFSIDALDLRFVPDNLVLPESFVDSAACIPENYKLTPNYNNDLMHSNAELEYEKTSKRRRRDLTKKFSEKDLLSNDLDCYIGNDDVEDSHENEALKSNIRKLFNLPDPNDKNASKTGYSSSEELNEESLFMMDSDNDYQDMSESQSHKDKKAVKSDKPKYKKNSFFANLKNSLYKEDDSDVIVDNNGFLEPINDDSSSDSETVVQRSTKSKQNKTKKGKKPKKHETSNGKTAQEIISTDDRFKNF